MVPNKNKEAHTSCNGMENEGCKLEDQKKMTGKDIKMVIKKPKTEKAPDMDGIRADM